MKIVINKAQDKDIDSLAQLFDQYRIFYQQKSDLDLATEFISARIKTQTSVIFFAQNSSEDYLGFTQLYPSYSSVSAQDLWILNDLYVAEPFRSKGVARALLNQANNFVIGEGAKGLALATAKENTIAQSLYESLGYERDDMFIHYFLPARS